MHKQILTDLHGSLTRFKEAQPNEQHRYVEEIRRCFNRCKLDDKETLTEMTDVFYTFRQKHRTLDWSPVDSVVQERVLKTIDRYLNTRKSALEYLQESYEITPLFITKYLVRKYGIERKDIRSVELV